MASTKGAIPEQLKKYAYTPKTAPYFLPREFSQMWGNLSATMTDVYDSFRGDPRYRGVTIEIVPDIRNTTFMRKLKRDFPEQFNVERKEALKEVGEYLRGTVVPRMFERERTRGAAWRQLRESTIRERSRAIKQGLLGGDIGPEHPILQRTGRLMKIAMSEKIQKITRGSEPTLVLGSDKLSGRDALKYYTHMAGGHGWGGREIPARPFIPRGEDDLYAEDKEKIKKIFQAHIYKLGG